MLGAHARAIGTCALDNQIVTDLNVAHRSRGQRLGVALHRCQNVAGLAAVAGHDGVDDRTGHPLTVGRHADQRMLCAVHARAQHLGHAAVDLEKPIAVRAGARPVVYGRNHAACVGDQIGARLDLQPNPSPGRLAERHEGFDDRPADVLQVGRSLVAHPSDLVAPAEVESVCVLETFEQPQTHAGDFLPHGRVRARPDVRMNALDRQIVRCGDFLHRGPLLVPDAEAGRGPADVGALGAARTQAGIEADTQRPARKALGKDAQLFQRAGIELHPRGMEFGEIRGQFLRGQRDLVRGNARFEGAFDLEARTGVEVQAEPVEQAEHVAVRQCLHGIARRQAERVGKLQHALCRLRQSRLVVHVHGRAEAFRHAAHLGMGEKSRLFDGSIRHTPPVERPASSGPHAEWTRCSVKRWRRIVWAPPTPERAPSTASSTNGK